MYYENNNGINRNQSGNEDEESQERNQFFQVSPDEYNTESDTQTILESYDEEDTQIQNQDFLSNNRQTSQQDQDNPKSDNDEKRFNEQSHEEDEEEHENENHEKADDEENHNEEEEHHDDGEEHKEEQDNEQQQGNIQEQEQEDQEDDNEENGISDPNINKLMKMDLADKEGIIDLLMKDNLVKKSSVQKDKFIKNQNKKKFGYVKPTIGKIPIGNEKSSYGRKGFQIEVDEGNPEFIKDINVAASVIKTQIEEENMDVAKILFDDGGNKKISKRITREQIDRKVKKTLEKRKKNLEKIEAEIYEWEKEDETFTPVINHRKGENKERRSLKKFLKDQTNFTNRIKKKIEAKLAENELKKEKEIIGIPQVNKISEELAMKLNNNEKKAYLRLYNQRNLKKQIIADKEKLRDKKEKEEENKRKEKMNENNKIYSHIKSKIDMGSKKKMPVYDEFGNFEMIKNKDILKSKEKDLEKQRQMQSKIKNKKGKLLDVKDIPTYKMLLNNFEKKFDEVSNSFKKENLTEVDFHNLLYNLGMVSHPHQIEENDQDENGEKNKEVFIENNPILKDEKKLIEESINCLKNEQNEINKEDIKNFLICVLGNQKYEFYRRYKTQHESELKDMFPQPKFKKEDIPELIIKKQNEEILSKINKNSEKNSKYAYRADDGKIYFSLEKGRLIKKDFDMFALNYRNSKKPSKDVNKLLKNKKEYNFRPLINENSEKLYKKFKDKVYVQTEVNETNNIPGKDSHKEYIERILLNNRKRIAEIQKMKEELDKKQFKECTFRPKINQEYRNIIGGSTLKKKNESERKNRMFELYEKGTADIKKKKDRKREEIEIEKQIKECTFHPNIKRQTKSPETKFHNDIYQEKEYRNLYERLKNGRMERLVKNSTMDRFGLNQDLKKYIKQNKENKNKACIGEGKKEKEFTDTNNIKYNDINYNENVDYNRYANKDEKENNNTMEQSSENDAEKKEGIPLLIIDVNIRQGVKKKIYVYEGDTPEGLAEKFSKENNLEDESKNKLQSLIHSHMVRLLTRIEEENQSLSEKSQTTHNNKK